MTRIIFILIIFCTEWFSVKNDSCPALYKRYSAEHTYCKSRNDKCHIQKFGISKDDQELIVKLHNEIRNNIAIGNDKSKRLPSAGDMLEIVYDDELAQIAQKLAEQCVYRHDCRECRQVENFPVGQNIYKSSKSSIKPPSAKWIDAIKYWYGEIRRFNPDNIYPFYHDHATGHFSQMIWSSSWRIGCGFVSFEERQGRYNQLYVCNYGPAGNKPNSAIYQSNKPCAKCPGNTCCGKHCKKGVSQTFVGLCKVLSEKGPDFEGTSDFSHFIFNCDFRTQSSDCKSESSGAKKWETKQILSGAYQTVVLNGGESTTLKFVNSIQSKNGFCFLISFRKGPNAAGQQDNNSFSVQFMRKGAVRPINFDLESDGNSWLFYTFGIPMKDPMQIILKFSVPKGAPPQYLDINDLRAKGGLCS